MKNIFKGFLTSAALAVTVSAGAVDNYAENFENLDPGTDPSNIALAVAGWRFFVFVPTGTEPGVVYPYEYNGFAPNGGQSFSAVATGDSGLGQGLQYLNVYADYGNVGANTNGDIMEASVYRELPITADDLGNRLTFTFDAKRPTSPPGSPVVAPSTAEAFIKTIDATFQQTNYITLDMTNISDTEWATFSISIDISDPALVGQTLQIGFGNTATNYENSGVFYDNITLFTPVNVPFPTMGLWVLGAALAGFGVYKARKS